MKIFRKLIRDKMPEIMKAQGKSLQVRVLENDKEYNEALQNKLVEEIQEMRQGEDPKKQIAYFYEIIDALIFLHGIARNEIIAEQKRQRDERGGFEKRLFLESERRYL